MNSNVLPTGKVCVKGELGYDWQFSTRFNPIDWSLPLGQAVRRSEFAQGVFAPLFPLFSQLHISLSTVLSQSQYQNEEEDPSETIITSPTISVFVSNTHRNGYQQYHNAVEHLIERELKQWDYSKNVAKYNSTFVFLTSSSSMTPAFHHMQQEMDGYSVWRFINFIFAYSPSPPRRFPSLWPWIAAKTLTKEKVSIRADIMIAQELFSIEHQPKDYVDLDSRELSSWNHRILNDPYLRKDANASLFSLEQLGFVNKIKFGEQLYMSLNITSLAPPKKPYFGEALMKGVREMLLESITMEEFHVAFPMVSFNVTFPWELLHVTSNRTGEAYHNVRSLYNLTPEALSDIVTSWRMQLIRQDPLTLRPIAVQVRAAKLTTSFSCVRGDDNENTHDLLRDDILEHTESFDEYTTFGVTTDESLLNVQNEQNSDDDDDDNDNININNSENNETIIDDHAENIDSDSDASVSCIEFKNITIITAGDIVQVHMSRCAVGYLPPQPVLELLWEMNMMTMFIAFSLLTFLTYLTFGSLAQQMVAERRWQLPFFVHIFEVPVRLRFLYLWPQE